MQFKEVMLDVRAREADGPRATKKCLMPFAAHWHWSAAHGMRRAFVLRIEATQHAPQGCAMRVHFAFFGYCEVLAYCGIGLVASILGELAAGVWRVPVDLAPRI